MYQLYSDTLH